MPKKCSTPGRTRVLDTDTQRGRGALERSTDQADDADACRGAGHNPADTEAMCAGRHKEPQDAPVTQPSPCDVALSVSRLGPGDLKRRASSPSA